MDAHLPGDEYPRRVVEVVPHDRPFEDEVWMLRVGIQQNEKHSQSTVVSLTNADLTLLAQAVQAALTTPSEVDRG